MTVFDQVKAQRQARNQKRREKQQRNQGHPYCWMKRRWPGDPGYHSPRIRRAILSCLTREWTEWSDLLQKLEAHDPYCNCPYRIHHVLDFLEENFRIESQPIHYWPRPEKGQPYPTLKQRFQPPTGKSLGHHDAYRLMTIPRDTVIKAITATAASDSTHQIAADLGLRWHFAFHLSTRFRYHQCPPDQAARLIHLATKKIPT